MLLSSRSRFPHSLFNLGLHFQSLAWAGFSIDPYLSGSLVHETVSAIQETGVIASVKVSWALYPPPYQVGHCFNSSLQHFIGNEQETDRNPDKYEIRQAVSSNIADGAMHELYLW